MFKFQIRNLFSNLSKVKDVFDIHVSEYIDFDQSEYFDCLRKVKQSIKGICIKCNEIIQKYSNPFFNLFVFKEFAKVHNDQSLRKSYF